MIPQLQLTAGIVIGSSFFAILVTSRFISSTPKSLPVVVITVPLSNKGRKDNFIKLWNETFVGAVLNHILDNYLVACMLLLPPEKEYLFEFIW